MKPATTLLFAPSEYYSDFTDWGRTPTLLATAGFLLASFPEVFSNQIALNFPYPATLIRTAFGSLIGAAISALLFGVITVHLGTKMMRGSAKLRHTVPAVGTAFFWPGALSTVAALLLSTLGSLGLLVLVVIQILSAGWGLALCVVAVKNMNGMPTWRAIVAVFWLIITVVFVVLPVAILFSLMGA